MESLSENKRNFTNKEIRELAYAQLKGNWATPVVVALIYAIVVNVLGLIPIPGTTIYPSIFSDHPIWNQGIQIPILTTLLGGAFSIGLCLFHLNIARRQKAEPMDIFAGFNQLFQSIIAALLIGIIVLVGFVLLIVPGVIAGLGLSQTYFIMADKPGTSATDAMQESWDMMRGYKADLFALSLSFVGWTLLAIFFTCGIGMLWVMPYMYVSYGHFYMKLKGEDGELPLEDHLLAL
jgi:uncharacterized membrane protein